jgi:dTDP-glucose pyrophosphorylase
VEGQEVSDVSVVLIKTGVNMGDHAQDVWKAVEVGTDESLHEAANRLLSVKQWHWETAAVERQNVLDPQYEWRLEVRLVEPIEEKK